MPAPSSMTRLKRTIPSGTRPSTGTAFTGLEDSRISAAYSADGRSWTRYDRPFTIGQMSDRQLGDVIILTADKQTGMYYLDTRAGPCRNHR